MKKVLVFLSEDSVLPKGGPSGYVYNLMTGYKNIDVADVKLYLLPSKSNRFKPVYDKLPLLLKNIYRVLGRQKDYKDLFSKHAGLSEDFFNEYDAIHFHSCFSLYKNIDSLKNYSGKVLLTSHCPKPPQLEMVEDMYSTIEKKLFGNRHLARYEEAVEAAFNRADYIIFPCEDAEEPYFNNWSKYSNIKRVNEEKYYYIPTGVGSCLEKVKRTRAEVRDEYSIPQDAYLVSYVGRHNYVKGYDVLKQIAASFTNEDNVYFLIAGEEFPLKRPNLLFWREVGWTNDPYSLEAASDLFILPNKETYFDLVLLEVLSIGVKVLASNTGGNKYFKQYDSDIYYFSSINDGVNKIKSIKEMNDRISQKNRDLYLQSFTSEKFAEMYLALLQRLL